VGCSRVTSGGDEHVDDLPELVDAAVQVSPPAGDLHIRLVHQPAVTDGVPARPGGIGEQGREPLDPPVDGDMVDLNAPFGEQFLDVAVGQAEAQIPANREHDDIGWEAEPAKADRVAGAGRGRRVLMPAVSLLRRRRRGCNSAPGGDRTA
jgi:hypothetical protein